MASREALPIPPNWSQVPGVVDPNFVLLFKLHFKQCNLTALEKLATQVSDPADPNYGQYVASADVCKLTRCAEQDQWMAAVQAWVSSADGAQVEEHCDYASVSLQAGVAEKLLPGVRLVNFQHGKGLPVPRAAGKVTLPAPLRGAVVLVTGLTELWKPSKHGVGKRMKVDADGPPFTQGIVTPRTLRTLYNAPAQPASANTAARQVRAAASSLAQGIVAFDDYYMASDLCAANTLLGSDATWLTPPQLSYAGAPLNPHVDLTQITQESNLDTQYMTGMGVGVPTTFASHAAQEWVLDWAVQATQEYAPDKGGPSVWSISYGWPELIQCIDVNDGLCASPVTGYEPSMYLRRTDTELQKLAAMGVTVLAASGDDGAAGFGATCPIDPLSPVDLSGGSSQKQAVSCPFANPADCKCASFLLELDLGTGHTEQCVLPLGLLASGLPGSSQCNAVGANKDCNDLLSSLQNAKPDATGLPVLGSPGAQPTCHIAIDPVREALYSECTCDQIPVVSQGKCSFRGYVVGDVTAKTAFGKPTPASPFAPNFPASSPWVTAVGATQIALDAQQSCGQAALYTSPGAETASSLLAGGFDSGGGFSGFFGRPAYQADAVNKYLDSGAAPPDHMFNRWNRAFPDLSFSGVNYIIVDQGQVTTVAGTSAAAPALAGVLSLLNDQLQQAGKPRLGHLNPLLYKMAAEQPATFNSIAPRTYPANTIPQMGPITVGSNACSRFSCCQISFGGTTDGWDAVTGHGTPNFAEWGNFMGIDVPPLAP
ncbi:peptidase S8/S53 domain-containing protein [Tribonema minus]|uniref:subtilisin n=1 Tax=Tribonema minus TaxID=303371 RepID=A0A835Z7S3_9STRA|nr:peptidase S8/S53 domain-containing protein [Tribonema minus]